MKKITAEIKLMKEIYVRLYRQGGGYGDETPSEPYKIRTRVEAVQMAFSDGNVFAFEIGTQTVAEVLGETLTGQIAVEPRAFVGSLMTTEQLESDYVSPRMIAVMKEMGETFAVRCRNTPRTDPQYKRVIRPGTRIYSEVDGGLILIVTKNGVQRRMNASRAP